MKQKAEKLIPLVAPAMAEEMPEIALDTIPPTPTVLGDLKMLVAYLSGHFESKNQTPDQVNYYDVQLDVIPIWKKKKDDYWLYVEEATAERAAVTYHQQVFHVYKMGSLFLRETYTIRNPMRYEGPKRFRKTLRRLRQDSLEIITGCEVYFRYDSGRFVGQTNRLTCPTKIPGAASGMQELLVSDSQMKSLDRGFDEAGEPVWGLVKGPFVFQRKRRE